MTDYREALANRLDAAIQGLDGFDLVGAANDAAQELRDQVRRDESDEWTPRHYFASVQSVAAECASEALADDPRDLYDAIHEACDGNAWVIYYHAARKCLEYSDNEDAIFEHASDSLDSLDSVGSFHCLAAAYAMIADVHDALATCGADVLEGYAASDAVRAACLDAWGDAARNADDDADADEIRATALDIATDAIIDLLGDRGFPDGSIALEIAEHTLDDAIVPRGCSLRSFTGLIAMVDSREGTDYLPREDYNPRDYDAPDVEGINGALVWWTMSGYLDRGAYHYGKTLAAALVTYLESECE